MTASTPTAPLAPRIVVHGAATGLLPVLSGLVLDVVPFPPHVNRSQIDPTRVIRQPIHDRVSRDSVVNHLHPVLRPGLR